MPAGPRKYRWDYLRPDYAARWQLSADVDDARFLERALEVGTTANGVFAVKGHWFQMRQLLNRLRKLGAPDNMSARELVEAWFPSPQFVHLIRQDKLRQAISYQRALHTGIWWKGHQPNGGAANYHVDYDEIERLEWLLQEHERQWSQYFTDSGMKPLIVTYEELCDNYSGVVRRIIRYLGAPDPGPQAIARSAMHKQAAGRADRIVHHYLTRQRAMGRSSWSWI